MIQILKSKDVPEDFFKPRTLGSSVRDIVQGILDNVKANGEKAIFELSCKFDKACPNCVIFRFEKNNFTRKTNKTKEFININGAYVADSPGFSRLDLKVELTSLARIFKDFNKYACDCKFNTCIHQNEPICAVKEAVEKKLIDARRYNNYLHLMKEIKDGKQVWRKK